MSGAEARFTLWEVDAALEGLFFWPFFIRKNVVNRQELHEVGYVIAA